MEPKEIEAALVSHPAVRHAHVLVDRRGSRARLIAFAAGDALVSELRSALRAWLPRFMMPHRLVVVDDIPLTANGKPDEAVLRAAIPESSHIASPSTDTERSLALVFSELLGVSQVDVEADVLEMGLDSITAVSAVQVARRRGVPLQARMIAECGTVRELAAAVDAATAFEPAAELSGRSRFRLYGGSTSAAIHVGCRRPASSDCPRGSRREAARNARCDRLRASSAAQSIRPRNDVTDR